MTNKTTNETTYAGLDYAAVKGLLEYSRAIGDKRTANIAFRALNGYRCDARACVKILAERAIAHAIAMVGCACYHAGEHGVIEAYVADTAVPMLRVRFGKRVATLKPSEIGATFAS
jgi:hypothetical protein